MKTQILCSWKPKEFTKESLKEEFLQKVLSFGFHPETYPYNDKKYDIEVRSPAWSSRVYQPDDGADIREFHKDGGRKHFIVWSNIIPTEIKFQDGSTLKTKDSDMILVNNDEVLHRMPDGVAGKGRWFIRTYLLDD